ncbi:MAG: sigma-54-dependent Fis family transcriptional regulator [Pseudomonadota bacterium]
MTQNNLQMESADEQKILVLDDDRLSAHNLGIQIKFVGEIPLASTSDNWKQMFRQLSESKQIDNIFAIAIGVIKSCPLLDLLNTLHNHFPELPLLLLNNQEEIQYSQLPESLQAKFLPLGDKSLNYRSLIVALQNARQLSGRPQKVMSSNIISDTGTAMFRSLSGQSESMQKLRQLLHGVAVRQVNTLVIGESGTGKEIVARNLHYHSGRSESPFMVINCASVAAERNGVELFGHEKNFNGATDAVTGLIEKAHGGTLFFDDVAELPLNVQGMLLRFLEDKKFQRMGGHASVSSDVRVVAATRYSLEDKIKQGDFRQDLYYRLSVVPIEIPPLRDHAEDIPDLIKELLSRLENKEHSSIRFNSAAIQSLQHHSWPGNVRELANLVERMCIIKPHEVIGLNDLPQEYQHSKSDKRKNPEPPVVTGRIVDQQTSDPAQQPPLLAPESAGTADKPAVKASTTAAANETEAQQEVVTENAEETLESLAMMPLTAPRLEQYLEKLERNLLEVAMADSANIMKFAAHRLKLDENILREKLQKHRLIA